MIAGNEGSNATKSVDFRQFPGRIPSAPEVNSVGDTDHAHGTPSAALSAFLVRPFRREGTNPVLGRPFSRLF